MNAPHPAREPGSEVDRLLREAMHDDLPADLEARLADRLRAFLFSRSSAGAQLASRAPGSLDSLLCPLPRWTAARVALALTGTLLLASGLGLQAFAASGSGAEPVRRINLSVSLFRALQRESSLHCAGMSDTALHSPGTLAASVYRRWVPVQARTGPDGALVATYRSSDPAAEYQLVLDATTLLPREVRRSDATAPASRATCTWTTRPSTGGAPPR